MERNYVVLSSNNEWLATLYEVEPENLKEEMNIVVLELEIDDCVEVFAYEFIGERIKL